MEQLLFLRPKLSGPNNSGLPEKGWQFRDDAQAPDAKGPDPNAGWSEGYTPLLTFQ